MNIEEQRRAFEEAFKKEHSGVSFWLSTWDEEEQSYGHLTAGWAWTMWLASVQREGYVMMPVEPNEKILKTLSSNEFNGRMIYKAIIEEAQEST